MKTLIRFFLLTLLLAFSACAKQKTFTEADIQIIPKPAEIKLHKGAFEFSEATQFVVVDDAQKEISTILIDKFEKSAGWKPTLVATTPKSNYVKFDIDEHLENEAYRLEVNDNHIVISAKSNAGFLYGLETIRQLLPVEIESQNLIKNTTWIIPNVSINDKPRFQYRGLMLDISRHFFGKDYIKKTIDRLAMLKMNTLHLHLVDDQGWRIEIKKYPKLTKIGAYRNGTIVGHYPGSENDNKHDGGFLTQEEIKEIVAYANKNNITVIPEIELPGHSSAAIAAYPYLSCFPKERTMVPNDMMSENSKKQQDKGQIKIVQESWGVYKDIYCAGKEDTFLFLEDVLDEIMPLFPSKYIHIGGDEAIKPHWKVCPNCKKRMQDEGLEDVHELQSYFVKRIEKYINSKGKKIIGWDEILEGGLAPDATVMSWRGVKGGLEASEQGHDVIMTPGTHCYFDHCQGNPNEEPLSIGGYTTLSKVYQFDPIVDSMSVDQKRHVLGGQANLWSEYIPTTEYSEYMIFPRLAALSETLWSPKASRDWNDFSTRIQTMFKRYEFSGINYAKSAYQIASNIRANLSKPEISIALHNEFPNADIRYVLGDKPLDETATKYTDTIRLKETTVIKASLFKNEKPIGKTFIDTIVFHKAVGKPLTFKKPFSKSYEGDGPLGMVNAIRGSKNFHDGQWQAWINNDMEAVIDLETPQSIHQVILGTLESQGSGIYFPTEVTVSVSKDNINYQKIGSIKRPYAKNGDNELKDFKIDFETINARYVKIIAHKLEQSPKGGGVWLFVDEILVD